MTIKTLSGIRSRYQLHPYHLVDQSPWPLITSFSLLTLTFSAVLTFHGQNFGSYFLILGFLAVIGSMFFWFTDVIREGSYQGYHTHSVQKGLNLGVLLFIFTEVMFFASIFWAFFHSSLAPTVDLGAQWPPAGIEAINAFELPLLNTIILLSSGATITYAHHSLIQGNRRGAIYGTCATILLALIFTGCQGVEYSQAPFTIADSVFGTCFFFSTGFHGLHVLIGTIFITVGLLRLIQYQLTDHHHVGYESSILYWHFVDVVWLFLFISVYWWGS